MSNDTPIPDAWIAYCAAFHELFPRSGNVELSAAAIQQLACNLKADGERENARLREQLAKQSQIYREQLYEIVDLRTKIDLITSVLLEITE